MLNLLKYEFKKNSVTFIVLISILLGLEAYFLYGFFNNKLEHMGFAASLLALFSLIAFFIVFCLGIVNYDKELNSKSSYLIFMTPNSSLKIIVSKLLYVILIGLFCVVIIGGVAIIDLKLLAVKIEEQFHIWDIIQIIAKTMGVNLASLFSTALLSIIYSIFSVLSTVAVIYLAITLSTTLLHNNRLRGFISIVFAVVLLIIVNYIDNTFLHSDSLVMPSFSFLNIMLFILPSLIYNVFVVVGCTLGCSKLIDKAISL